MTYKKCRLYKLKSKKTLCDWLQIDDPSFLNSENIAKNYYPFIKIEDNKKRLIEASSKKLKSIQTKILGMLRNLDYPRYLFSGLRGKSFIDNAKLHSGKYYTFKIDISKFFPNTSRNKVYYFFKKSLQTSADVAKILTDCTTVDIRNYRCNKNYDEIIDYLEVAKIKQIAHLSTGAPSSMILSFLANQAMFDELFSFCEKKKYMFTVYADDVTISSLEPIPFKDRKAVIEITNKYGHVVSNKKVKYYNVNVNKKITGVVINTNGETRTSNKLIRKTHYKILKLKNRSIDSSEMDSLKGCVSVAYQIDNRFKHLKEILKSYKTI